MMTKITEKCSMGCSHCMNDAKKTGNHMSFDTFKKVVEFYKQVSPTFGFITGGEPFEHPDCIKFIEYYLEEIPSAILTIATNGVAFESPDIAKFVYKMSKKEGYPVTFQVSTDTKYYPYQIDTNLPVYHLDNIVLINKIPKIYPQGRAVSNNLEWKAIGSKCFNCRAMAHQMSVKSFPLLLSMLAVKDRFCTPHIDINGNIKLGESDLCPVCSNIFKPHNEIFNDILKFDCNKCDFINKNLPSEYLNIIKPE